MRKFIFILSTLWLLSGAFLSLSQGQRREIPASKIENLKAELDFSVTYKTSDNPLARLWYWFLSKIFQGLAYTGRFGNIVFYLIIAAIIIYAVIRILKIDIISTFYGSKRSTLSPEFHEDISKINFDQLIQEAFQKKDYREVVRLYYLRSLQYLDDTHMIKWEKGKTNLDYLYEIEQENTKKLLSSLNYYFEYAVYGDFEISEKLALESQSLYKSINASDS